MRFRTLLRSAMARIEGGDGASVKFPLLASDYRELMNWKRWKRPSERSLTMVMEDTPGLYQA